MIKIKAVYPCGMRTEMTCFSLLVLFFGVVTLEDSTKNKKWYCPLHGQDCSKYRIGKK